MTIGPRSTTCFAAELARPRATAQRQVEHVAPRALFEGTRQPDFTGVGLRQSRRVNIDQEIRASIGLGADEQGVETMLAVDHLAEQAAAQAPIAEGRVTEQAHVRETVLPYRPFLRLKLVGDVWRQLVAVNEHERGAGVVGRDFQAIIGADLGPVPRTPDR